MVNSVLNGKIVCAYFDIAIFLNENYIILFNVKSSRKTCSLNFPTRTGLAIRKTSV